MSASEEAIVAGRSAMVFITRQLAELENNPDAFLNDREQFDNAYLAVRAYGVALLTLSGDWEDGIGYRPIERLNLDVYPELPTEHTEEELAHLAQLSRAMLIMAFDPDELPNDFDDIRPEPLPSAA